MTMTINGLGGGAYTPGRRPMTGKRRRAPDADAFGAGAPVQPGGSMHASWLSEQSRAEIAAVAQAIQSAETATEIVDAASGGLRGIGEFLAVMRREIEPAAGLADSDQEAPRRHAAHQREMAQAREEISELVNSLHFGRMRLLDGGLGCTGMAFGDGLDFLRGSPEARASSPEGYPVWIRQEATRTSALVRIDGGAGNLARPPRLFIEENGLRAEFVPEPHQELEGVVAGLRRAVASQGLRIVVEAGPCGQVLVHHTRYGAANGFMLGSSAPGGFSNPDGSPRKIQNGLDVVGAINGEPAQGEGQILTGCAGNRTTDGLAVRFRGHLPLSERGALVAESLERLGMGLTPEEMSDWHLMGRVILAQQPLVLRLGAGKEQVVSIRLNSMHPRRLGLGVENAGEFRSLAELRLGDAARAQSALLVLGRAEEEVDQARRHLEKLKSSVLKTSLAKLRGEAERQRQIFTNIADARRAQQVAQDLRSYMQSRGPAALLAQMQPLPGTMVRLLTDESVQAQRLGREC